MGIRLGVHVSIAGGMEKAFFRARQLGCTAMQIFSRSPRAWKAGPLSKKTVASFRREVETGDIDPVIIHTPYLLNLASGEEDLQRRSIAVLKEDIERAQALGVSRVVTHLGSAKAGGKEAGLRQVINALKHLLRREFSVSLLLENSAGGGNSVGSAWEELQEIIERVGGDERLGICFDSCHGFAAGYDFRSPGQARALARRIRETIGWKRMALLHLNDCDSPCGGHWDRHQHIGQGFIGPEGFRSLLGHPLFRRLPMILETPKKYPEDDRKNMARLRRLLRS